MTNLQNTGLTPNQSPIDLSGLNDLIRDNPNQLIQALDSAMFFMSQNAFQNNGLAESEFNSYFALKQLRDELLMAVYNLDLS